MRSRFRKKKKAVKVEVVEFSELTSEEEIERLHLERQVERSFYIAGKALQRLRDLRLYRNTHRSFEEYCRSRFGFERRHPYRLIEAACVVDNLTLEPKTQSNKMCPNGTQILPTSERQVRPLTSLEPEQQREVWQEAIIEAGERVPPARIVKDIVQRIRSKNPVPIPFRVGEVCQIIVKDNPELRGKGGCWCIVRAVDNFSCTVDTFDNDYQLRPEHLKSLEFSAFECERMKELGARMNDLYELELEEAALGILNKLARINRSYLTELEENLLILLEKQYKLR
jgi:hypothetical protein